MLIEEFQDCSLMHGHLWCVNGVIFAISESPYCHKPSIKFLLKRIYGLEDVRWKIAGWLFRAWQSLICEWSDFSYFWISMMPETFHQVFAQENIWFGRCWRNPRWLFSSWPSFVFEWNEIIISESPSGFTHPIRFLLKRTYGLEEDVVWRKSRLLFSYWPSLISE